MVELVWHYGINRSEGGWVVEISFVTELEVIIVTDFDGC